MLNLPYSWGALDHLIEFNVRCAMVRYRGMYYRIVVNGRKESRLASIDGKVPFNPKLVAFDALLRRVVDFDGFVHVATPDQVKWYESHATH